jgi:hypothetical protein
MSPTPDRIRRERTVTAMATPDTVGLLAERVTNLISHGRRIAIARRYRYVNDAPEVTVGLTPDGDPEVWQNDDGAGFYVRLKPGIMAGFGFAAYAMNDVCEADAWKRYRGDDKRRDMTRVDITGGMTGDGPARDDALTILHWNRDSVCTETVVAFDYETGRHNDLTRMRDELPEHVANLSDKQPWENQDILERTLAALEAHAAVQAVSS